MSEGEWRQFKDALWKFHRDYRVEYNALTQIHLSNSKVAHKIYILLFEQHLRKINSNVSLPYWDWSFDSQDPLKSPIWDEKYLGMSVGPEGDCSWKCDLKNPHCLVRNYDHQSFSTFHDSLTLLRLIQDKNMPFVEFSATIEQVPHGLVHASIGGPGGDMSYMHSPNDPLFWLHHGFIDKIWYDRQIWNGNWYEIDGQTSMKLDDDLIPFTGYKVIDSMNLSLMCYEYVPLSNSIVKISTISKQSIVDEGETEDMKEMLIKFTPLAQNQRGIILPNRVPDSWLAHHNFNKQTTRSIENKVFAMTRNINEEIIKGVFSKYPWINGANSSDDATSGRVDDGRSNTTGRKGENNSSGCRNNAVLICYAHILLIAIIALI